MRPRRGAGKQPCAPTPQTGEAYQANYNYAGDAGGGSRNFSNSDSWRRALLGTVAAGAMFFGYGRSARADCVDFSITTVNCTGDITGNTAPFIVGGGIIVPDTTHDTLNVNNLNETSPGSGIAIEPDANVDGINFERSTGDITINSDTSPYSIVTTGAGRGIYAKASAGDVTIDSRGDVSSDDYGILALSLGSGAVSVTSNGDVMANSIGIRAYSSGGDVRVESTGDVTTPSTGIYATSGSGDVTVKSTGDFTLGSGYGILAHSVGSSGDAKVISDGNITGTGGGLRAFSASGDATVKNTGDISVGGGVAIQANSVTGDATVKSTGDVTSNSNGIRALGAGEVKVWSSGNVTSNGLDGIYARNSAGGPIDITIGPESTVTSYGVGTGDSPSMS